MKILQITTSSKGGAGIAALRLHEALRSCGIESAYLAKDLTIGFNGDEVSDTFFTYQKPSMFQKMLRKIELLFSPNREQELQNLLVQLKSQLAYEMLSLPYSSYELENHPLVQEAAIINLHMVSIILDYNRFFSNINIPIVWTLHDTNPFSGLFHYHEDADRNEVILSEIENEIRAYKKEIIRHSSIQAIVAPSQWMTNLAIKSKVFQCGTIFKTIPNSISNISLDFSDLNTLRVTLGIDVNSLVLLFVAHNLSSARKGIDLLVTTLSKIQSIPITLLVIGKGEVSIENKHIKTIPLGVIQDSNEMSQLYAIADALVLPSREDNLPNVMLEAFATGTPVISFNTGGMASHVKEGITGMLAESLTPKSLASTIKNFLTQRNQFDPDVIKAYAKAHFSSELQARTYTDLYRSIHT